MISRSTAKSSADSDRRLGRARSWISRITKHVSPQLEPTASTSDYLSQLADDSDSATLCTPPSFTQQYNFTSTETASDQSSAVLDSARVNIAVAIIVRARQQDQLGNHETAVRLMVTGMEHLARSLRDVHAVGDQHTQERLTMLRLLLEPGDEVAEIDLCNDTYSARQPTPVSRANDGLRGTCLVAFAGVLELVHQLIIIWLVLLGNTLMWLAVQFKQSMMPEFAAKCLIRCGRWTINTCRAWSAHEYAIKAGQMTVAWLAAVDRETAFSQKVVCALAAILGAVARVVEDSSQM
ncbi:hypothetical protein GGH96_003931 [Coemansia sp. RSA 1972]|nr:hypothetical protein GGH96_003931 [Coemansia sp. RSA 1972]